MSGTYSATMGDRGRLVIPADVRDRAGLTAGTPLVIVETEDGLVVMTRAQLRRRVRADLDGLHLVDDLLTERREAARLEDAG